MCEFGCTDTVERWEPIPGFTGYEASSAGRVRSVDRIVVSRLGIPRCLKGRVLSNTINPRNGYRTMSFAPGYASRASSVHRLVLAAFAGPCPKGMEARHLDGNRLHNCASNLQYGTHAENILDTVRHGTHGNSAKTECAHGHAFVEPNLVPVQLKRGNRYCLACNRADATIAASRRRGLPLPDFQRLADEKFAAILENAR